METSCWKSLGKLTAIGEVDNEVDLYPCGYDLVDAEDVRVVVEAARSVVRSAAPWWRLSSTGWWQEVEGLKEKGWCTINPNFFSHNRLPLNKEKKENCATCRSSFVTRHKGTEGTYITMYQRIHLPIIIILGECSGALE